MCPAARPPPLARRASGRRSAAWAGALASGGAPGGTREAQASGWEAPAGGWPGGTAPGWAHTAGGKTRLIFLYS